MAVSTTDLVVSHNANGVLTAFSFPSKVLAETDVRVYLETAEDSGVFTLKTLSTHYTVSFDAEAETCTVTFLIAPDDGVRVGLTRETPRTQGTNLDREGRSPAKTLEGMVDKATMLAQEALEKVSRAPLFPVFPADADPVTIDPPEDGMSLVWQDNGDGTWTVIPAASDPASSAADAASAAASAAAAAASATAAAAAASGLVSSGLASARPGAPSTLLWYWSTDSQVLELYIPAAVRWFLVG